MAGCSWRISHFVLHGTCLLKVRYLAPAHFSADPVPDVPNSTALLSSIFRHLWPAVLFSACSTRSLFCGETDHRSPISCNCSFSVVYKKQLTNVRRISHATLHTIFPNVLTYKIQNYYSINRLKTGYMLHKHKAECRVQAVSHKAGLGLRWRGRGTAELTLASNELPFVWSPQIISC